MEEKPTLLPPGSGKEFEHTVECMLFVAGDPVPITELSRTLSMPAEEVRRELSRMELNYQVEQRGVQILVTDETVQMISNRAYYPYVEKLLQPEEKRSVSQSLMETLAIIAYRQPVTRGELENIRGVRCDYAVHSLLKMGLITEAGRRDALGHPMQYQTTDRFLRQFGIHRLEEMPEYQLYSVPDQEEPAGEEHPV